MLGDPNAMVHIVAVEVITGGHEAPGVNENREKPIELCTERGMVIRNMFKKRGAYLSIHG